MTFLLFSAILTCFSMRHSAATIHLLAWPIIVIGFFAFLQSVSAQTPADKYPRISNNYMKAGIAITPSDYDLLAKHDLLVFPAEAQIFNPRMAGELRRRNPDIVILAYVPTKSFALVWSENPNDSLHRKLLEGIQDEWRLRDGSGNQLSVWPRTWSLNMNSGWADYLPEYVHEHVMSSGYWDGIFYDESSATISWLNGGDLDLNNDGRRDNAAEADRLWEQGMVRMLKKTRNLLGQSPTIIINGDSHASLQPYVNGRMFETFPTPWEGNGTWEFVINNYLRLHHEVSAPPSFIINSNTENTGNRRDYRRMRFGLASALLGDGYFHFDFGDQDHGQLWFYDEYEAHLGRPIRNAENLTGSTLPVKPGLWKREFENGIVLVNSTEQTQTATLSAEFERLHGIQDPDTNNGEISNIIDVPPKDGLLLFRPLEQVSDAAFVNGAFTRILNQNGHAKRTGFFAFTNRQQGGLNLAQFRVPNVGRDATVVAKGNRLELYTGGGTLIRTIYPFGANAASGISFSIGEAGGKTYLAVGAGPGSAPQVRLYDAALNPVTRAFNAYHPSFTGGVHASVGDLDADGQPDIVTGAGAGGGPHVRVFNAQQQVKAQFFAYGRFFTGGVNIGVGDVDGDGTDEIVSGAGFGGGPHVRVFNLFGEVENQFFAYDERQRNGVRISVGDIDSDGRDDILAMTNDAFSLSFSPLSFF